jgi:hypothetical protein
MSETSETNKTSKMSETSEKSGISQTSKTYALKWKKTSFCSVEHMIMNNVIK